MSTQLVQMNLMETALQRVKRPEFGPPRPTTLEALGIANAPRVRDLLELPRITDPIQHAEWIVADFIEAPTCALCGSPHVAQVAEAGRHVAGLGLKGASYWTLESR